MFGTNKVLPLIYPCLQQVGCTSYRATDKRGCQTLELEIDNRICLGGSQSGPDFNIFATFSDFSKEFVVECDAFGRDIEAIAKSAYEKELMALVVALQ